jgi:hypothetical protein
MINQKNHHKAIERHLQKMKDTTKEKQEEKIEY